MLYAILLVAFLVVGYFVYLNHTDKDVGGKDVSSKPPSGGSGKRPDKKVE